MKMVIDDMTYTVERDGRSNAIKVTERDEDRNIEVYGPIDLPDGVEPGTIEYTKAVRDTIKRECQ